MQWYERRGTVLASQSKLLLTLTSPFNFISPFSHYEHFCDIFFTYGSLYLQHIAECFSPKCLPHMPWEAESFVEEFLEAINKTWQLQERKMEQNSENSEMWRANAHQ